jgi:uncharacterized protein with HEPN domain
MKTRNDKLYIYDIAECCKRIEQYISEINEDEFQENYLVQDAVVRNIEIIGEAAKNLSEDIRKNNPQVEWRDIMRMRDKIAHQYFRVDLETVWRTAAEDIPKLKPEIQKILSPFS